MAFEKQRHSGRASWILLFFWILSACAYRQPPLKSSPKEPPPPVKIKIEIPVHPKPETPAHLKPAARVQPKPKKNIVLPKKPALKVKPPSLTTSGFYSHKVRWPEETLSHIAQWYTGTVKNWRAIAKANPNLDPKKIGPGDTILIPKDLLTSRKPMPFSFLHPSIHKKVKPPPSPNKTAKPSDSPKLFGPIDTGLPPVEPHAANLFGPVE